MRIVSTSQVENHLLKILIFGESGIGKTYLASTIKEPMLFISAESGTLSLKDFNIDVVDISRDEKGELVPKEKRINRLLEVYTYLNTQECRGKYKWLYIDSLTEINQNLVEQLQVEFPDRKDSLVLYGELAKKMRAIVKNFRDIPFYNVVMVALSEIEKDENGQRFNTVSLIGNFASKIAGYFDEVFFYGLFPDKENVQHRMLLTSKTEKILAKDRSGKLDKLEKPNLATIASKIKGE